MEVSRWTAQAKHLQLLKDVPIKPSYGEKHLRKRYPLPYISLIPFLRIPNLLSHLVNGHFIILKNQSLPAEVQIRSTKVGWRQANVKKKWHLLFSRRSTFHGWKELKVKVVSPENISFLFNLTLRLKEIFKHSGYVFINESNLKTNSKKAISKLVPINKHRECFDLKETKLAFSRILSYPNNVYEMLDFNVVYFSWS